MHYKKMAGTSAVFVCADYQGALPVERDGPVWTAHELHFDKALPVITRLPSMANVLALEGLEEYDPPVHGNVRHVQSLHAEFIYWQAIRGWIQYRDNS